MKKNRKRYVAVILFLVISLIMIVTGVVLLFCYKDEKVMDKKKIPTVDDAIQIITNGGSYLEEDLQFIEMTKDDEFKILSKKNSNVYDQTYLIVDVAKKEYYVMVSSKRGDKTE